MISFLMFKRQTTGSVVCPSCHQLVGVNEEKCYYCGRPNPGMWGYAGFLRQLGQDLGFVQVVIWSCAGLYIATLLADPGGIQMGGALSLFSPSGRSLFLFGASGAMPLFQAGRWWTVLSAAWLHGGLLHIVFNMMWVRQLAPATASEYGIGRTVIIYTVSSITGFFLSSWMGAFFGFLPWPLTRGNADHWRLSSYFRTPGSARLRRKKRKQRHRSTGHVFCRHPLRLWIDDGGYR